MTPAKSRVSRPLERGQRRRSLLQRLLPVGAAAILVACSTARPWINQPISATTASAVAISPAAAGAAAPPPIVAAVTLSGGGARAAAFGLGVLEELKATRFEWEGRTTSLLDEVGLISGVSGGSILATYYAAFGDEVFSRFHKDFLRADFQSRLIHDSLSPPMLYKLSSPWWGRSNALARRLDPVFQGMTFGDLRAKRSRPQLLITATDLTTGGLSSSPPSSSR